jgi:hypothetical protein
MWMLISKLFGTKRAVGVGVGRSGKFRKQNTKVMYIKLPMYLFFIWLLDVTILMRENPFRGPLKGVGPENQDFFVP